LKREFLINISFLILINILIKPVYIFFIDARVQDTLGSEKYGLYLLSNTNPIHYQVYIPEFFRKYGSRFEQMFDAAYWSFRAGMRKPSPEFFRLVLEENNLKAEECLFIDDTVANTQAATACGIKALLLKPEMCLTQLFDNRLNLLFE